MGGGELEWLLQRMYRELRKADFATIHVVESLAREISVEIVRRFKLCGAEGCYRSGGLPPWQMRLIRERADADGPLPQLKELANLCNVTVRHLARAFRAETGQTIGKFVESVMIERANAMLKAGAPVGQIAGNLGYASSGSFAYAFRRSTGLFPSEVRSNSRHG